MANVVRCCRRRVPRTDNQNPMIVIQGGFSTKWDICDTCYGRGEVRHVLGGVSQLKSSIGACHDRGGSFGCYFSLGCRES